MKSVKSDDGANVTCMPTLTMSMYIDTIKKENPKQLNVTMICYIQYKPVQYEFHKRWLL